ncbi:TfoX/Sxy family protein [Mesobacterium pallidum]|uniref:TfoX/Sxy family protein n=1 Tax=Mesobacterium pallidum TaxID=2872037 RepID=UPI001EE2C70D|nr:TfoX/Sxy family protein [Mesobacterium pallidum]
MSLGAEDIAYVRELFDGLGDVTTRRMMGGMCLYHDGTIFAMVRGDGQILLKGAGAFIPQLEAEGCTRWVYTRDNGKSGAMPYWTLPEAAMDDPEVACDWARRALAHL